MKKIHVLMLITIVIITGSCAPKQGEMELKDWNAIYSVDSANPRSIIMAAYTTTMFADGQDETPISVFLVDSLGRRILTASNDVTIRVTGDGSVVSGKEGIALEEATDSLGQTYWKGSLSDGMLPLVLRAGNTIDKVKVEVRTEGLWPASHEIHLVPAGFRRMVPGKEMLKGRKSGVKGVLGADISFLPQLESRGLKFSDKGEEKDAILLLKDRGFNYIRLRIFVNPENEKGYSPVDGYCGLDHTLEMAKRVKEAGMGLLLNFHYSDYWADPQQQNKPKAWEGFGFDDLKAALADYSEMVVRKLAEQGTMPDMVQIGNEINHGMVWPEGHISNPDNLAALLIAGTEGVKRVDASIPIMMHLALGGQKREAEFWFDNMMARGVDFDIIGLSYYPQWHATLNDLNENMRYLAAKYNRDINLVEYSALKKDLHEIVFTLPEQRGTGTFIWEPLNTWSAIFDRNGNSLPEIEVYDEIVKNYLTGNR